LADWLTDLVITDDALSSSDVTGTANDLKLKLFVGRVVRGLMPIALIPKNLQLFSSMDVDYLYQPTSSPTDNVTAVP